MSKRPGSTQHPEGDRIERTGISRRSPSPTTEQGSVAEHRPETLELQVPLPHETYRCGQVTELRWAAPANMGIATLKKRAAVARRQE